MENTLEVSQDLKRHAHLSFDLSIVSVSKLPTFLRNGTLIIGKKRHKKKSFQSKVRMFFLGSRHE